MKIIKNAKILSEIYYSLPKITEFSYPKNTYHKKLEIKKSEIFSPKSL